MPYRIVLALGALLTATAAQACRGPDLEDTLFFTVVPEALTSEPVVAKVILEDVQLRDFYKGLASARVQQVLRAPGGTLRTGDTVSLRYQVSSCGPYHRAGEQGTIVAWAMKDQDGHLVLWPYGRRYSNNRLTPPCPGQWLGQLADDCDGPSLSPPASTGPKAR